MGLRAGSAAVIVSILLFFLSGGYASNSTTFKTCSKKPELVQEHRNWGSQKDHVAARLVPEFETKYAKILQGTQFSNNVKESWNGLIWTVLDAYNNHHNLVLRPDDIWIGIITQFSYYVNANSEKFRGKFVNFQGKKELKVTMFGSMDTAPYNTFVEAMTDEIHKNLVDATVKDWVIPDFTTTTKDDKVTSGIILMATMKKYFDYKMELLCGIPSVTLEGTVEDWKKIKAKLRKLSTYSLAKWVEMLEPIIEKFIQAKEGKVDEDFWGRICDYKAGGSGPSYISGWIAVFSVFNRNGEWQGGPAKNSSWPQIDMQDVASGIVEVNVTIVDNGAEHKAMIFAGHMGSELLKDGYTLQPKSGWAIALKSPK